MKSLRTSLGRINVTKSYLPTLVDYIGHLERIWQVGQITNHGELVKELEEELKQYLGAKHLFLVANGTIALQVAIKALGLSNKIITTPFSYVATTSSIVWEGCEPVFADIDAETLCIDPVKVESLIDGRTEAILATHVYGNPCAVEDLEKIAKRYNLKIIYDAAHAFGVKLSGRPILDFGDISTLSFHATKVFHTGEGGAIVTDNDDLAHRISYMINFGHNGPEKFFGVGINGKMSELHAAMGLAILPAMGGLIARRQELSRLYDQLLSDLPLKRPTIRPEIRYNYSYYPVLFPSEEILIDVMTALSCVDVFPRRYFYPSLSTLNYVKRMPVSVAEDVARRVLCLPLYFELSESDLACIVSTIQGSMTKCVLP